jgi:hypothetical protein
MRIILWSEISLRLQCVMPTMSYTLYELRVRDWIVGCLTFCKWNYGGRCHLGCSFPSLVFTSLLLWISAQYRWSRHGFLPPPEISQVQLDFLHVRDPANGYHTVLISCGTYGFVGLRTLNGCLIVYFLFLLLSGIMQHRASAHKEGDNVIARLHMTFPGPGNSRLIQTACHECLISSDNLSYLNFPHTTLQYWHPHLQSYLPIFLTMRPYSGVCLYTSTLNIWPITVSNPWIIGICGSIALRLITVQ